VRVGRLDGRKSVDRNGGRHPTTRPGEAERRSSLSPDRVREHVVTVNLNHRGRVADPRHAERAGRGARMNDGRRRRRKRRAIGLCDSPACEAIPGNPFKYRAEACGCRVGPRILEAAGRPMMRWHVHGFGNRVPDGTVELQPMSGPAMTQLARCLTTGPVRQLGGTDAAVKVARGRWPSDPNRLDSAFCPGS
jgi:hypothetical protein